MKWVLIASVLVTAVFVGTFYATGNTWSATNAAGVISFFVVVGFLYRAIRPPVSPRMRRWTSGIATVVIAGTVFYWSVMYSMTNWQYDVLHVIHKVIQHGVAMDMLKTRGLSLLRAYALQSSPKRASIGEIFRSETTYANPDSAIIEYGFENQYRLFAASVSDTQIVLVCQSTLPIDGENKEFRNFDGRTGMTQDRLVLTKRGMVYEIQN